MSEFNKGIDFAFEHIEKKLVGKVLNGRLEGVITQEDIEELKKNIPRKCAFCTKPCGKSWCPTKSE